MGKDGRAGRPLGQVEAVAFSPDGRLLATGSVDTTVRLWSTTPGSEPVVFRGHAGGVHSLAFSPEGHTLAVGSADGVVKFWNIRALREVATLKAHGTVLMFARVRPGWSDAGDDLGRRDDAPVESAWLRRDRQVTLGTARSRELSRSRRGLQI